MAGRPMNKRLYYSELISSLIVVATLCACSAYKFPTYSLDSDNQYGDSATKDGLFVAIRPLADKQELRKYFGVDLLSNNVLPLFVFADNRTTNASFVLMRDDFLLTQLSGDVLLQSNTVRSGTSPGGHAIAFVGAATLAVPLLVVGTQMEQHAFAVKQNIIKNELRNQSISPGRSVSGFVYVQMNEKTEDQARYELKVYALRVPGNDKMEIKLGFSRRGVE
jgi:hypothetical protein